MIRVQCNRRIQFWLCVVLITIGVAPLTTDAAEPEALVVVIMDPLSQPLSCDCVAGYAQRDYEKLGEYLENELSYPVRVVWNGSLVEAIRETKGRASLVIGKHSVVEYDAERLGAKLVPRFSLTGKDGRTTQHGLVVVRSDDTASRIQDLDGYRVFFGPEDHQEKSGAARSAIAAAGVQLDEDAKTYGACSEAAVAMLESAPADQVAAVISSYAGPLLEGCGSIQKGDLKVIGKTKPVPFITAFFNANLPPSLYTQISLALTKLSTAPELLTALETAAGFVPFQIPPNPADGQPPKTSDDELLSNAKSWPGFRGVMRNAQVAWLPETLPTESDLLWSARLPSDCVGGIAVDQERVILGTRDASDSNDMFLAFQLADGALLWVHQYPAPAELDYGNAPRATPQCCEDVIVTLGATGTLSGLDSISGSPLWSWNLSERFDTPVPTWGWSSSPLRVDGSVLLQGDSVHSLFAVDWINGKIDWSVEGSKVAYASLVALTSKRNQSPAEVLAIKDDVVCCHNAKDGALRWSKRLGKRKPFGVPSAVITEDEVLVADEIYGISRLRLSDTTGDLLAGTNDAYYPDSQTPVQSDTHLLVAHEGLHCLDLNDDDLATLWSVGESTISGHASIIASPNRAMVLDEKGNWLLVQCDNSKAGEILDRQQLGDGNQTVLAHPAIVGDQLLMAVGTTLSCYQLTR